WSRNFCVRNSILAPEHKKCLFRIGHARTNAICSASSPEFIDTAEGNGFVSQADTSTHVSICDATAHRFVHRPQRLSSCFDRTTSSRGKQDHPVNTRTRPTGHS